MRLQLLFSIGCIALHHAVYDLVRHAADWGCEAQDAVTLDVEQVEIEDNNQNHVVQQHQILLDAEASSDAEETCITSNDAELSFT